MFIPKPGAEIVTTMSFAFALPTFSIVNSAVLISPCFSRLSQLIASLSLGFSVDDGCVVVGCNVCSYNALISSSLICVDV